jgi:hypothetical protein
MPRKNCLLSKIYFGYHSDLYRPSMEFRETHAWFIRKLFTTFSNMFFGFKSGVLKKFIGSFLVNHEHFYAVVWSNIHKYTCYSAFLRYRPARLDLHESGIIGKPFKSTSTAIGFKFFYFSLEYFKRL